MFQNEWKIQNRAFVCASFHLFCLCGGLCLRQLFFVTVSAIVETNR